MINRCLRIAAATTLAVLVGQGPVFAEISPSPLWQRWQDHVAGQDRTLAADSTETAADGTLRLGGVTLSRETEDGTYLFRIDRLEIAPAGGGAVRVTIPPNQSIHMSADEKGADPVTASVALSGSGVTLDASGELDNPTYAVEGNAVRLTLDQLDTGDAPSPATFTIDMSALKGTLFGLTAQPGSGNASEADLSVESLAVVIEGTDPASGTEIASTMDHKDVRIQSRLERATAQNWNGRFSIATGAGTTSSRQSGGTGADSETTTTQARSSLRIEGSDARISYAAGVEEAEVTVRSPSLPVGPVSFKLGSGQFGLSLPLATADAAQQVDLALTLDGVDLAEALWNTLDPGAALPRQSARLELAMEADVVLQDAPIAGLPDGSDALPSFLPTGLRLTSFALSFAEADLSATGDFTIPTIDAGVPIPDIANPVGTMDLTLTGGMTLLQKMLEGGLVTPEQAMGAQMMMGMFAIPGDGDTLTTTVETEPGGGLTVNGNRLR